MSLYNQITNRNNSISKKASDGSIDTEKMKIIAEEMKLIAKHAADEEKDDLEKEVEAAKEAAVEVDAAEEKAKEEAAIEAAAEEAVEEEAPAEEAPAEEAPAEDGGAYEALMQLLQDPENAPESEEEMQAYDQLMQLLNTEEAAGAEYPDELSAAIAEMVSDGELTEEEAVGAYQMMSQYLQGQEEAPMEAQASATDVMVGLLKEAEEEETLKEANEAMMKNIEKAAFDFLDDILPKADVTPEKYASILLEKEGETAKEIGEKAEKLASEEGLSPYKVVEDIINRME